MCPASNIFESIPYHHCLIIHSANNIVLTPLGKEISWDEEIWIGAGTKPLTRPGEAFDVKCHRLDALLSSMPAIMSAAQDIEDAARYVLAFIRAEGTSLEAEWDDQSARVKKSNKNQIGFNSRLSHSIERRMSTIGCDISAHYSAFANLTPTH